MANPDPACPAIQELLKHAAWARRFARTLIADESAADDLVQDAWCEALRRPPHTDGPVRAWLTGVLKHRAATWRRRRTTASVIGPDLVRDLDAAPDHRAATPLESLARREAERLIADSVVSLEEPFRTAVLLRFYEDLTVPEIAARLGVPKGTISWRLHRAVEIVRGRLHAREREGGGAWLAAVAPLAESADGASRTVLSGMRPVCEPQASGAGSFSMLGGAVMNAKVLAATACAALAVAALLGLRLRSALDEAGTARQSASELVQATAALESALRRARQAEGAAHAAEAACAELRRELEASQALNASAATQMETLRAALNAPAAASKRPTDGDTESIRRVADSLRRMSAAEDEIWNLGGDPDAFVDESQKIDDDRLADTMRRRRATTNELFGQVVTLVGDGARASDFIERLTGAKEAEEAEAWALVLTIAREQGAGSDVAGLVSDALVREFRRTDRYPAPVRARMLDAMDLSTGSGRALIDDLVHVLRTDADPALRRAVARHIGLIEHPSIETALREVIDAAADDRLRALALRVLGLRQAGSGDESVVAYLRAVGERASDQRIRAAATEAALSVQSSGER